MLAAALAFVAAAHALRLTAWRPGTPWAMAGDAPQVNAQIRSILEGHWYGVTPRLGAPFGMNQGWFTTADVLNFTCIRLIGLTSDSPATVGAVFFLLGFPAAAVTAYWLARTLAISRAPAVVVGVLFAVLPGHQLQYHHLWLASYWMVPLALWLVIAVATGQRLWPSRGAMRGDSADAGPARWMAARTTAIVLVVGLADIYYVAFTLLLLAVVLVIRLGTGARARHLAGGAAASTSVALLCGGSLLFATRSRSSAEVTGTLPAGRGVGESELYSGKLIELLLPWHEHRATPLRFLTNAYSVAAQPSVERPALGLVALFGVTVLCWVALSRLALGRPTPRPWGLLAALTLVALAFYTRGGLGSVVALFFTPQIRTWSRLVLLVALLGLLAFGLCATRAGRGRGRRVVWSLSALALVVGVLDQTNPAVAPDHQGLHARQADLQAYGQSLAGRLDDGCSIFQLPVVVYPEEPPPGTMEPYEHLLPANASPRSLRWGYGAIRGTAASDWQLALPVSDHERLLDDLAAVGFCAVEVNAAGYPSGDSPEPATRERLGAPLATATNGRLTTYDLRPLRRELQQRLGATFEQRGADVLGPVVVSLSGSLVDVTATPFQWTGPDPTVTVSNLGATPTSVSVTMRVEGVGEQERTVTIEGVSRPVVVSEGRFEDVTVVLQVPPGRSSVRLSSTGTSQVAPGTQGRTRADLRISDLRVEATDTRNAASLHQFSAAGSRRLASGP